MFPEKADYLNKKHAQIPTLFDIVGMEQDLSKFFSGRKVDLRTPEDLSRHFRQQVVSEAEVLYAGE